MFYDNIIYTAINKIGMRKVCKELTQHVNKIISLGLWKKTQEKTKDTLCISFFKICTYKGLDSSKW